MTLKLPLRLLAVVTLFTCTAALLATDSGKLADTQLDDATRQQAEKDYERRRALAHSRMPDTMYASNPSKPVSPHADEEALSKFESQTKPRRPFFEVAYSQRPYSENDADQEAENIYREHIDYKVESDCTLCHIEGGLYKKDKLVLEKHGENQDEVIARNIQVFKDFVTIQDDAVNYILTMIRGDPSHLGGRRVDPDSEEYEKWGLFLRTLSGEKGTASGSVDAKALFDGVELREDRKVLRQAALIFAGRIPTPNEYASLDETGLRPAIRNLMQGDGFHEFLIRASNDRLLTDREKSAIDASEWGPFVEYSKRSTEFCKAVEMGLVSDAESRAWHHWESAAEYASVRAPLELIAYVVENDLPYTEILTADYIMTNPQSAEAYGSNTEFNNPTDIFEFQPSQFRSYYLLDDSRILDKSEGSTCRHDIIDPGNLLLDYPHAGILNSPVFMKRYPTTATNRNRARSRWTYYHFSGLDIEKSRSRTTDPDALADTNNPTLNNPACTGCHTIMDPVAGTYQNYDEQGFYRQQFGGKDSLDHFYKEDPAGGEEFIVEALSFESRQTLTAGGYLKAGSNTIGLRYDEFSGNYEQVGLRTVTVKDSDRRLIKRYYIVEQYSDGRCGNSSNDHGGTYRLGPRCPLGIQVRVPHDDFYQVDVEAWLWEHDAARPGVLKVWVPGYIYEEGDTWYRDMLPPGYQNSIAPNNDNSVQWLSQQIIADENFAKATVKFWWPALHGNEVSTAPSSSTDVDFKGREIAAIAQDNEVERLATAFRSGINNGDPYNLKDLLVEMVLSDWFRAESVPDDDPVRAVALLEAGAKRLLTPEELASKTAALSNVQWGREFFQPYGNPRDPLDHLNGGMRLLYGGIDSDGITERARDLTAVMAGVAKSHATEMSCPIVLRELYILPDEERRIFKGVDLETTPVSEFSELFDVLRTNETKNVVFEFSGILKTGKIYVNIDLEEAHRGNDVKISINRVMVEHDEYGEVGPTKPNFNSSLPATYEIQIPEDGNWQIKFVARIFPNATIDQLPKLEVNIESDTEKSAGSRTIRQQLTNLYRLLLDANVTSDSPEIDAAYNFFSSVWTRNQNDDNEVEEFHTCLRNAYGIDHHFFEGILSDYRRENEDGLQPNEESINAYMDNLDLSDSNGIARTWHVMLVSILMDQRYLHL